jgi:SAM-dependent methyltransferase
VANLTFAVGDAERLPFAAESFDVVVNVESSHCYGDVGSFFREVVRVLRPGGWFLFADARPKSGLPELEASLAATQSWHLTETEDLTKDVLAALAADDERKRRLIGEVFPPNRRKIIEEFAALSGTAMYRGFRENSICYKRWTYRKASSRLSAENESPL